MKRTLLLMLAVVAVASTAFGQAWIGLYTDDPSFADCNLEDVAPGLCTVYMVQGGIGAISSEFRIDDTNRGTIGTPLGTNWTVPVAIIPSGETVFSAGVSAGYGSCRVPPIKVGELNYFCSGTSPACSSMDITGHAQTGDATVADCTLPSPVLYIAERRRLTINGDVSCPCGPITPVEATSWGQIKALYTE